MRHSSMSHVVSPPACVLAPVPQCCCCCCCQGARIEEIVRGVTQKIASCLYGSDSCSSFHFNLNIKSFLFDLNWPFLFCACVCVCVCDGGAMIPVACASPFAGESIKEESSLSLSLSLSRSFCQFESVLSSSLSLLF